MQFITTKQKRSSQRCKSQARNFWMDGFLLLVIAGTGSFVYAEASELLTPEPLVVSIDPNTGVAPAVKAFFVDNDAEEMLPIIACESQFQHYDTDGSVLKNREGSNAIGVAQIMSSVHPDPKVLTRYNKRNNTDLTEADFDLTTLEGNLGYALVLYEVRGVRDWECADLI